MEFIFQELGPLSSILTSSHSDVSGVCHSALPSSVSTQLRLAYLPGERAHSIDMTMLWGACFQVYVPRDSCVVWGMHISDENENHMDFIYRLCLVSFFLFRANTTRIYERTVNQTFIHKISLGYMKISLQIGCKIIW